MRRRYTVENHIAEWRARYVAGRCSLETFEWVVGWALREAEAGRL